jgi:uncharacterized membrane protein YhaH (DUF805 family)
MRPGRLVTFRGRLSRPGFWLGALALWAAFAILFVFLESAFGRAATLVLYPPLLWMLAVLCVQRLHDRGRSAAWLLILLIPIVGPLWLIVELAFRAGTPDENPYGRDPLARADYLTVA